MMTTDPSSPSTSSSFSQSFSAPYAQSSSGQSGADAVERYQYLLRTAPPDQLEKAHEEAFAAMSASERAEVLSALSNAGAMTTDDSAAGLARSATRLEMSQPGSLSSALSSTLGGRGGALLGGLAAGVAGSAVINALFDTGGRPGLIRRLLGGRSSSLFGYGQGGGYAQESGLLGSLLGGSGPSRGLLRGFGRGGAGFGGQGGPRGGFDGPRGGFGRGPGAGHRGGPGAGIGVDPAAVADRSDSTTAASRHPTS